MKIATLPNMGNVVGAESHFRSLQMVWLFVLTELKITGTLWVYWRSRQISNSQICSMVQPSGKSSWKHRMSRITWLFVRYVQIFNAFLHSEGRSSLTLKSVILLSADRIFWIKKDKNLPNWFWLFRVKWLYNWCVSVWDHDDSRMTCSWRLSTERRSHRWFHQRHLWRGLKAAAGLWSQWVWSLLQTDQIQRPRSEAAGNPTAPWNHSLHLEKRDAGFSSSSRQVTPQRTRPGKFSFEKTSFRIQLFVIDKNHELR